MIGFDPGIARLGYGIVYKQGCRFRSLTHGCLTTAKGLALPERLLSLSQGVQKLLTRYRLQGVTVERLFFQRNVTTAFHVGQVWGVLSLHCAQVSLPVRIVTPSQVKMAVTGYGRADKKQVQHMVTRLLGLPGIPQPDDTADALAVAICGLQVWDEGGR
nr:crossover junction endodeoxyribonuclease RuvC [Pasteuria penetrans]